MTVLETLTQPVAATGLFSWAWLLIAIPAVLAAVLLVSGRAKWGPLVGIWGPIVSFVLGLVMFIDLLGRPDDQRRVSVYLYDFIQAGDWTIPVGLLVDQLSILFVLLITGVGSLIFIYSLGYMAHDERRTRFFAYLNLFITAMLILVLADNYLILFVGWEGVGLASYLLISFWQERDAAAKAGKKAFVANRVGDLGMVMAISAMLAHFGSTAFVDVNQHAGALDAKWATLIGLFLLLGACGKSAQVPLQSWLLDAMEGPTPVSALIHAATMVTAGVYLVVRSQAIYAQTPTASLVVAIVGTVTLLAGAWIGCAKDDIKKVLAGSTMSQIGYMMLAAGLGPVGIAFAIFHLITHGAFKANMFLGAGSVMHAMGDDVNMRHFGALRKALPVTFWTFVCGYLAIIGFPLTSGFFSKDHIIEAAFDKGAAFGVLALIGAGVTAFYMTRLMMMTFGGNKRWLEGVTPHESPASMTIPLIVLAVLSIGLGAVMNSWIQGWLSPAIGNHTHETSLFTTIGWITLGVVAVGVALGWYLFRRDVEQTEPETTNILTLIGRNDLYGDAFNHYVLVQPGRALVSLVDDLDTYAVDGAVRGTGGAAVAASNALRKAQNGYVRSYALTMVGGVVLIGLVLFFGQLG